MINDKFQNRKTVIAVIMVVIVAVYVLRLFSLQILDDKYKKGAASNAFFNKTIYPPRGLIYDRNDTLLVYNKPAYDIVFINREIQDLDTLSFCNDLKITKEYFEERMKEIKDRSKNPSYSSLTPQIFMTQLEVADIATVQQSMYKYIGFYIQTRTLREYRYGAGGHVLGSIGEATPKMLENDEYLSAGDYAGRDGLEYTYEKDLRGEKGMEVLLRDARGRIKGKYEDGVNDISPKAGKNLKTTLDINLQMLGEKLLSGKVGSVVAIEPKTGEILAMVSNPTFSPSLLVGRERSQNYNMLLKDPIKPLYNRATQATYSPGSTFKTFQAAVGLQLGGITPTTRFTCNGTSSYPIRCTHYHGSSITLLNAIEQSCNPYFWQTFRSTIEKDGYGSKNANFKKSYDAWRDMTMAFGFGAKFSDTDIYQQSSGNIPSTKFYNKLFGETGWRAITIRSLAIGQGEVLVTPLQLANATASIANRGYYITPHLNKADSMLTNRHETNINKEHLDIVDEGMWRVNEFGTARHYKIPGIVVCGKTGTVQNNKGKDHAFFIGYAPRDNPKIVIAVVVENAGFGATWAAPISSLMMEKYLTKKLTRPEMAEEYSRRVTNPNAKKY
ncbi:MAG: penicillin-binding protein 2 [Paludibacteraceae bacterium]